ncbi:MAG: DUF1552 domain-containing protein [Myxococcota bacterium]
MKRNKQIKRRHARRMLMSRRNVLRASSGACLALPFLASMPSRGSAATGGAPAKRFLPIYFPNGASRHWWTGLDVSGVGDQWSLSPVLSPLQPLKSKVTHIRNLGNYTSMQDNRQVEPSHARCSASYLTCVDADASDWRNGVSVDQVLVEQGGFETPIDSLQVGLGTLPGFFDGRPWHYNQSISWRASDGAYPTEPLRRVISPREIFEELIPWAEPSDPGTDPVDPRFRESILDEFLVESAALKQRLSRSDSLVVEQFETRVRELEILTGEMDMGNVTPGCVPIDDGLAFHVSDSDQELVGEASQNGVVINGVEYQREAHADVINQLIAMAFQCDLTRVVSYMLDDARSAFNYSHVTIEDFGGSEGSLNYHDGAQHNADPLNNAYASITQWMTQKTAELAMMLDAIPEGEGTMLDNTLILFGSGMHSDDHDAAELPIVLIGGGSTFRHDQNVVLPAYPDDRQIRDLHYTILNEYFDVGVDSFGDDRNGTPNAVLSEILA